MSKILNSIPNPEGEKVQKGDLVKITSGELIGFVGEITEMVNDGKNIIKTIKVIKKDGKVTFVEVTTLSIEFVAFADKIAKSGVFKKIVSWFKKLFRKKNKNKPNKES